MIAEIIWNPDRNIFVIPYLQHPVTWYGVLFAFGFLIGFFLIRKMFCNFLTLSSKSEAVVKLEAIQLTDRLAFLVVVCGVIGARLGHVFFYEWPYYQQHPISIFKIWEGGLASHGGAIGILISLGLFVFLSRHYLPKISFLFVLDALVVPAAFVGGCIRIGNFINQEITGIPTHAPWGMIFLQPLDGLPGITVHPVQLYESFFYFIVFCLLYSLWKKGRLSLGEGRLSGLFFTLIFGFRFCIDYLKMPQNTLFDNMSWIAMGQLLSLPFIALGLFLLTRNHDHATRK